MSRTPRNRLKHLRTRGKPAGHLWLTPHEVAKLRDLPVDQVMRHENGNLELDEHDIIEYARIFKVKSYEIFVPAHRDD